MPRPKRVYKRVVYAESSSSSTTANPQGPAVVPPIVIRVRPELPRFVPAAGRSGPVQPPSRSQAGSVVPPAAGRVGPVRPSSRSQAGSVVPPAAGRVGPVRPPSRSQAGSVVPPRVTAAGRSAPFVVESFVRPSCPVRSAFRPFVPTAVPQPPPASPSERGPSVGSMPALVPIWPPTVVAASASDDGFPTPLVSSEGSSSPLEPLYYAGTHSRILQFSA
ncbi:hypothetical protein DAPPUDRAFT_117388 [Daphnia pulex]|uniref:Uncharacterized protein n=1 Tax=Daphnia pulex TaxID=6669 RepID=E9HSH2_DAPPU|nr:hypothetical protein DAPPUDRAFT_117388 [Daphnia pulex]|eukprot:EFX65289.1 hypothetical protein DAPPUDRAFT_117388 [Daphnia pulex]